MIKLKKIFEQHVMQITPKEQRYIENLVSQHHGHWEQAEHALIQNESIPMEKRRRLVEVLRELEFWTGVSHASQGKIKGQWLGNVDLEKLR